MLRGLARGLATTLKSMFERPVTDPVPGAEAPGPSALPRAARAQAL